MLPTNFPAPAPTAATSAGGVADATAAMAAMGAMADPLSSYASASDVAAIAGSSSVNTGSTANTSTTNLEYAALLQIGVNYCQLFGGKLWTDYNEHDPGLTILEQLVYAITDILYRSNFSVADILAEQPQLEKPGRTSLFTGNLVLTGNPLTITDYRKYLYDAMNSPDSNFKNVWLVPVQDGIDGLYDILLETVLYQPEQDQDLIAQAAALYHATRNLTEDVRQTSIMPLFPIRVVATIEIDAVAEPNLVLADVLYALQDFLVPFVNILSIDKLMQDGIPADVIYEGPLLQRGTIADDQFTALLTSVAVCDIKNVMLGVSGVEDLRDLTLNGQTSGAVAIPASPPQVARLTPSIFEKQESYPFTITRAGVTQQIDPNQVYAYLSARLLDGQINQDWQVQTTANADYCTLPKGQFRDIASYFSIQRQFPRTYGIGETGIMLSQTINETTVKKRNLRTAQAQQLKAYLLFFEQLLTDSLAQLANAAYLFSLDDSLQRSYFWQSLVEPDIGPPYIVEQKLLVAPNNPPIPPCERHVVVYLSLPDSTTPALRSPEFATMAQAQTALRNILIQGQRRWAYKTRELPNGQFLLWLEDACRQKLAFACQRFASQEAAIAVSIELAEFITLLAQDEALQQRYIRICTQQDSEVTDQSSEEDPDGAVAWYLLQLNQLVQKYDPFLRRRNRFLDNLLARFGQRFDDALLAEADARLPQKKGNFYQNLIDWKIGYLRHFVTTPTTSSSADGAQFSSNYALGGERGKGLNPWREMSWAGGNLTGLQYRLTWLLGLVGTGSAQNGQCPYEYHSLERGAAEALRQANGESFVFQSGHASIFKALLVYGIEEKNYSIALQQGRYQVLFKWPDVVQPASVFDSASRAEAQAAIERMVQYLKDYAEKEDNYYLEEELHVIDHILLRPLAGSAAGVQAQGEQAGDQFYSFRISVIFPDWPLRFQDVAFRELAQSTLLENCPAHVQAKSYWLNARQMQVFKQCHTRWQAQRMAAEPDLAAVNQAAAALAQCLRELDGGQPLPAR